MKVFFLSLDTERVSFEYGWETLIVSVYSGKSFNILVLLYQQINNKTKYDPKMNYHYF